MTEKEYKGLLSERIYNDLTDIMSWDKRIVQVNFYFSNSFILERHKNITIRVRCIDRKSTLQIKVKTKHNNSFWESTEYEAKMPNIPVCFSENQLRQVWSQYIYGDVELQGFLVTERLTKKIGDAELMLDRNSYNGIVDYELEIECLSNDCAEQLVHDMGLTGMLHSSSGKYTRFCQTLNYS